MKVSGAGLVSTQLRLGRSPAFTAMGVMRTKAGFTAELVFQHELVTTEVIECEFHTESGVELVTIINPHIPIVGLVGPLVGEDHHVFNAMEEA